MRHQRVQLMLTFCKLSQFQFGSLQCLLRHIGYRCVAPSNLMSLCVWPFQTILRFCEADYYAHVYRCSKSQYTFANLTTITSYFCKAYYHYYLLLLITTYYITTITTHFTSYSTYYSLAKLYTNYSIMAGCSIC